MATPLPITTKPKQYDLAPVQVVWTASDNVNGNTFVCTGRETVHAKGTGTITIHSTVDPYGRGASTGTGDIVQALGGNEYVFQRFNQTGYATLGLISITSTANTVLIWIEQAPA